MTVISLLGPPGSGKTTQAQNIAKTKGLLWVSPGHIFRSLDYSDASLSQEVNSYTQKGLSVPSELTYTVLKPWLNSQNVKNGYVFDSHPRNHDDFVFFKQFLDSQKLELDLVIRFKLEKAEAMKRLTKRAYVENRQDETQEAVEKRFAVFQNETLPLIETVQETYQCVEIDASAAPDELWGAVQAVLKEKIAL